MRPRARSNIVTAEAVYGTVLVSGMIVVSGGKTADAWFTFVTVMGTVVVFWAAHVYAGAIAAYGANEAGGESLRSAFITSMWHSIGFLTAALPPSVLLLLGALEAVPDLTAMWIALWLGVVILGMIGYWIMAQRGGTLAIRLLGAAGTASLGFLMILLKVLVH